MYDVFCTGILVTDILVKSIDKLDYRISDAKVDKIMLSSGGDAMNTALALSKLGSNVCFCGRVGKDVSGSFLLDTLRSHNIEIKPVIIRNEENTAHCLVLINSKNEHAFFTDLGAMHSFCYDDIDISALEKSTIVHAGGVNAMPMFDGDGVARLFKKAKSLDKTTTMDVTASVNGKWLENIESCLAYLDYFLPSYEEAVKITNQTDVNKIADFFLNRGTKNVVIKLGAKGCFAKNAINRFSVSGFKVPVIDTTGAGDCFVAGFISSLLHGKNMLQGLEFANAVSAHCVQHIGATAGVPDYDTVCRFIEKNKHKGSSMESQNQ